MLRLSRNLYSTLRKCCPCLRKCRACHGSQNLRNLCVAVPMGPRSKSGPRLVRPGAANRLAFSSPETPIHAQGHAFCTFLFSHHTRTHVFSRAYSFACHLSQRASFQLVAVARKFLLNFLCTSFDNNWVSPDEAFGLPQKNNVACGQSYCWLNHKGHGFMIC